MDSGIEVGVVVEVMITMATEVMIIIMVVETMVRYITNLIV